MSELKRVTVELKKPIVDGSGVIATVQVREMLAGDLRGAPEKPMETALHIIGKITGLTKQQVDQLSMPDMEAIQAVQQSFLSPA